MRASTYNVIQDFGVTKDDGYLTIDPYWIIAIYRLGQPLSFSRQTMSSTTKDLTQGALLRAQKPLVITDDCLQISVSNTKTSQTKTLNAFLKQTDVNYLVEILPGDWVVAWIVNNRAKRDDLLVRINKGDAFDPCNLWNDGLKFVGRVDDVFKEMAVDPASGTKLSNYSIKCAGFEELSTQVFYDYAFASPDQLAGDIGQWCARFGVQATKIFGEVTANGVQEDNVNRIIPQMLNMVVGEGPDDELKSVVVQSEAVPTTSGGIVSAQPQLDNSAPYAYMIPCSVGYVLGKTGTNPDKAPGIMSYADILELLMGVQSYSQKSGPAMFTPDLDDNSPEASASRHITKFPMMGTFLPMMPDFANRPLWSIFQQYLNQTINEMYTCLRANPQGNVVPTIVLRQIPFTTDAFVLPTEPDPQPQSIFGAFVPPPSAADGNKMGAFNVTKFLDLPRWEIPETMIKHVSIGRSNATRTNFVHVYGQSAYLGEQNVPIQAQMIENPPVRDDLDIMRSGMRPYMTTVECWVSDQHNKIPGRWMRMIADWAMGSQYTLSGSIEVYGIQAPICEGDNVVFDGCVFHIMSVNHQASINPGTGMKTWSTTLTVTNGLRDLPSNTTVGSTDSDVSIGLHPIYPGFDKGDNKGFDPGLTLEQQMTTGGDATRDPEWDDPANQSVRGDGPSQLNPNDGDPTQTNPRAPTNRGGDR
jgi:hypothetical protein